MDSLGNYVFRFLEKLSIEDLGGDRFGMSVSQGLLTDLERALGQGERLAQLALSLPKQGKIIPRLCRLRMVQTKVELLDAQRALKERFRVRVLALHLEEICQAIARVCHQGMIGT